MNKSKRGYYDVFVRSCGKYSSRTAVSQYEDGLYKSYTYSELYGVCEFIAQTLQQMACHKGVIGLITERNFVVPSVIAAAHKCNSTFMFIDPSQDIELVTNHINFTLIILIQSKDNTPIQLFNKSPDKVVPTFNLLLNIYCCGDPLVNWHDSGLIEQHSFIASTSGSTGEPKHIQVPIQCIKPNIDDLTKTFDITPEDVIYFSTPLTFDPSMVEILLACMNGASLLIAPEEAKILFPANKKYSITFWQTTPSKFFQYSDADIKNRILSANSSLKILALGGEPLTGVARLKEVKDPNNATKIFTLYGVTEMSCWACVGELELDKINTDKDVPLGKCLSETDLVIEDHENNCTGKIVLVSKTRNCIVLNRKGMEKHKSVKFIDTGDLGEKINGTIYYRGRTDDTIKRFGHKVNLHTIETTIMQCPRVKACSCVWLPKPMLLLVYFTSDKLNSQELLNFIKSKLDDKYWPDKAVRVDNLPTNSHGKISKVIITRMYEKMIGLPQTMDSLQNCLVKELNLYVCKSFPYNCYEQIKDKDFFSLGGTSFLAVSMCNRLSSLWPHVGKLMLPYLLSSKNTIGHIMEILQKEIVSEEVIAKKKRRKDHIPLQAIEPTSLKESSVGVICSDKIEINWSFNLGKCVDASPTVVQTESNIYVTVGSHSGKIIIVDALTGVLQGMTNVKSRVEAPVLYCEGHNVPPCGVVGTYTGLIVCFSMSDCSVLWKTDVGSMVKSKGASRKGVLYIASYDGNVRCLNMATGNVIEVIHVGDHGISADLVLASNTYLLVGTLSGICACIDVTNKEERWRFSVSSPVFAKPVLYNDDKYVVFAEVNGGIHCRTVDKGVKLWEYQCSKGNVFSSIYVKEIDKRKWQMVFGCHDSNVYSFIVENDLPTLHWMCAMTSPVYATPCGLGADTLVVASKQGTLCILDLEKGTILAEHELPNQTFSSPATVNNNIFIGCRNDYFYSLKYNLT